MYFDTYSVESDKQGRITLPKNLFRSGRIERGGTLCLYPVENYWIACDPARLQTIVEQVFPGSSLDPDVRDDRRNFMIEVRSLHIDPQGRIPLLSVSEPVKDGRYVLLGTGLEFEIWPDEAWQKYKINPGGGRQ